MMSEAVFGVSMRMLRIIRTVALANSHRSLSRSFSPVSFDDLLQDLLDPLDLRRLPPLMSADLLLDLRFLQDRCQRLSDCLLSLLLGGLPLQIAIAMSEMSEDERRIRRMIPQTPVKRHQRGSQS